jgi:ubiquinone/menaquinone biosynthesis C-methylase UbiE
MTPSESLKAKKKWGAWLCPALSLAVAIVIALLFGMSFWTVFFVVLFLACPILAVWSYFMGQRPLPIPVGPVPHTRGVTLNWMAPWYDTVCSVFGLGKRFRDRTLAVAELRPGDHVLDVGCGTGVLTRRAADAVGRSGEVWGIDPAPDMVRVAMQEAARVRSSARFEVAVIEALPFEEASFDVALANVVIHHLPPDLKPIGLREVHRVLKPGGRLVVVDLDRPRHWLWQIVTWPMSLHPNLRDHLRGRTADMLQNAGFVSVATLGGWVALLTFWSARKPAP